MANVVDPITGRVVAQYGPEGQQPGQRINPLTGQPFNRPPGLAGVWDLLGDPLKQGTPFGNALGPAWDAMQGSMNPLGSMGYGERGVNNYGNPWAGLGELKPPNVFDVPPGTFPSSEQIDQQGLLPALGGHAQQGLSNVAQNVQNLNPLAGLGRYLFGPDDAARTPQQTAGLEASIPPEMQGQGFGLGYRAGEGQVGGAFDTGARLGAVPRPAEVPNLPDFSLEQARGRLTPPERPEVAGQQERLIRMLGGFSAGAAHGLRSGEVSSVLAAGGAGMAGEYGKLQDEARQASDRFNALKRQHEQNLASLDVQETLGKQRTGIANAGFDMRRSELAFAADMAAYRAHVPSVTAGSLPGTARISWFDPKTNKLMIEEVTVNEFANKIGLAMMYSKMLERQGQGGIYLRGKIQDLSKMTEPQAQAFEMAKSIDSNPVAYRNVAKYLEEERGISLDTMRQLPEGNDEVIETIAGFIYFDPQMSEQLSRILGESRAE